MQFPKTHRCYWKNPVTGARCKNIVLGSDAHCHDHNLSQATHPAPANQAKPVLDFTRMTPEERKDVASRTYHVEPSAGPWLDRYDPVADQERAERMARRAKAEQFIPDQRTYIAPTTVQGESTPVMHTEAHRMSPFMARHHAHTIVDESRKPEITWEELENDIAEYLMRHFWEVEHYPEVIAGQPVELDNVALSDPETEDAIRRTLRQARRDLKDNQTNDHS